MCQFFSGLAFKNGDIHYNPMTDSHEYLIEERELDDKVDISSVNRNWVRFEYTSDKLSDLKTYKLKIDESSTPGWCDKEYKDNLVEKLRVIVKSMILCDVEKKILIGGCWILTGGSIIDKTVSARIILMDKTSKVGEMCETSQVGVMRGTSKVGVMWETSKVGVMCETSQVGVMRGTSKVVVMCGTSQVGVMWETSKVGVMCETSKVGEMLGTSQVGVNNSKKELPKK